MNATEGREPYSGAASLLLGSVEGTMTRSTTTAAVGAADPGEGLDAEFFAKLKDPGYLDTLRADAAQRHGAQTSLETAIEGIGTFLLKRLDEAAEPRYLLAMKHLEELLLTRAGLELGMILGEGSFPLDEAPGVAARAMNRWLRRYRPLPGMPAFSDSIEATLRRSLYEERDRQLRARLRCLDLPAAVKNAGVNAAEPQSPSATSGLGAGELADPVGATSRRKKTPDTTTAKRIDAFLIEAYKLTVPEDWPPAKWPGKPRKIPTEIPRRAIWRDVIGQMDDKQFGLFQAEKKSCQQTSRENFERVLNDGPEKFIDDWRKARQKANLTPSDPV